MKQHGLLAVLAFFLFTASAVYITYPLLFHMKDFANGEYVIAWILNWDIHSVLKGNFFQIFQANIYYPFLNSLAYSDFLFSSSLFSLFPYLLLREPMVPSNITFISSLIFLGFFTYLLAYYMTKNFLASLLSGMLIVFSPAALDKRIHLQILSIEWVPLAILFFLHYSRTGKFRYMVFSLFFFIVQTYNSFMAGYFLVFSYISIGVFFSVTGKVYRSRLFAWKSLFAFFAACMIILPICIPYYQVSHTFRYVRDIRDTIHFAIQPEDLFFASEYSRLNSLFTFLSNQHHYPANAEIKPGFLGVIFSLLSIFTFFYAIRQSKRNIFLLPFIVLAFTGLILSFGPAMHFERKTIHNPFLIPLPYALFYYVLPGFEGFRNSARFEMLYIIAMPISVSIMLDSFLATWKTWIMYSCYAILLIGIVLEFNFPIHFEKAHTFEQFPPVYAWIADNTPQNAVIIEEPMYNWDNNPFGDNQEVKREYYSTVHFRKLVGGGSGFSPPPWQSLANYMFAHFPSNDSISKIKKLGVTYIVVHTSEYDILHKRKWVRYGFGVQDGKTIISMLNRNQNLVLKKQFEDDYIYLVH